MFTACCPQTCRTQSPELDDLSAIDGLFEDMKKGTQFGKLVIEFGKSAGSNISIDMYHMFIDSHTGI
jgi:hypothetical protein